MSSVYIPQTQNGLRARFETAFSLDNLWERDYPLTNFVSEKLVYTRLASDFSRLPLYECRDLSGPECNDFVTSETYLYLSISERTA
jgi:hypothetical protein